MAKTELYHLNPQLLTEDECHEFQQMQNELMYHHVCCLYSEGINNEYLVEENKLDSSDEDVFLVEICYILRVHNKENIGAAGASI